MTSPTAPRRVVWRSAGLRLAAQFGFIVLLSMLAALALVYIQVSVVLHKNVERRLQQAQQYIVAVYESVSAEAAAQSVARQMADGKDTDAELYLLTHPDGTLYAGNLTVDALASLQNDTSAQVRLPRGDEMINARVLVHRFPDNAQLVVGHSLMELDDVESLVASASVFSGLFALLLAAASAWFFRRELGRSVGAVHQTIEHIRGGELQARVPLLTSGDDEFAQLEQDFNHMLDHIEQLMSGVRHVSDTIAHNVRTPLTRIRLRLQAAFDDRAATPATLKASMVGAIEDIDSVSHMLDKLLTIAQAEAGMHRRVFEPLTWAEIATEVIELYEDLADEEGIRIEWRREHDAPLSGDRSILAGALVNVLDNAIKYAGRGAHITITTRLQPAVGNVGTAHSAPFSEIIVSDNGPALNEADIGKLGERFVRLQPDKPGHGLGLASVRAMLRLHGGDMHLASARPGLAVTLSAPTHPRKTG